MDILNNTIIYKLTKRQKIFSAVLVFVLLLTFSLYLSFFKAPKNFPLEKAVIVESGYSLSQIAESLNEQSVIKSPKLFKFLSFLMGGSKNAKEGDYLFRKPVSVLRVAYRITNGKFGIKSESVTIPEGASVVEISQLIKQSFPIFDKEKFLEIASEYEGYLFPDTYSFFPNVKPKKVVEVMRDNFDKKMLEIKDLIAGSENNLEEIITMASILEKETITREDKEIVAGLLWKRIEIGMPLQVDATFLYINGKSSFDLTLEDLKKESPYNTYTNKGLPIGPIVNPGMEAIISAIKPKESPYLFYLSDMRSIIHYAKDFEEHKKNKSLYLR